MVMLVKPWRRLSPFLIGNLCKTNTGLASTSKTEVRVHLNRVDSHKKLLLPGAALTGTWTPKFLKYGLNLENPEEILRRTV